MKLPLLFSEPSSPYTWITPPEDVGDTLLADRERVKGKSTRVTRVCEQITFGQLKTKDF